MKKLAEYGKCMTDVNLAGKGGWSYWSFTWLELLALYCKPWCVEGEILVSKPSSMQWASFPIHLRKCIGRKDASGECRYSKDCPEIDPFAHGTFSSAFAVVSGTSPQTSLSSSASLSSVAP